MGPIRKQQRRLRRQLTRHILTQDPQARWRVIWSDLGFALQRWTASRVEAAVLKARGANAMGQVLASLRREPKLIRLKRKAA